MWPAVAAWLVRLWVAYVVADAITDWLGRRFPRCLSAVAAWLAPLPDLCPRCGHPLSSCFQEQHMAGYANRVVRLAFPHLTEDGQPELFITIKNPKVMPPHELTAFDIDLDPVTGAPKDPALAAQRSTEIIARLVIAWRMYDATDWALDEDGNLVDQHPLPLPATPDLVRRLPSDAFVEITRVLQEAMNPR